MTRLAALCLLLPSLASAAVSPKATDLGFEILGLPVTNSILTTWIIGLFIIVGVRLAVGTPKLVPGKGQAVVEGLATGLRDALEPIVGKRMIGKTFPILCGFFVFILLMNWSGLLPGVGTAKVIPQVAGSTFVVAPGNQRLEQVGIIESKGGRIVEGVADFSVGFESADDASGKARHYLNSEDFKKFTETNHTKDPKYHWEAIRPANADLNTTLALSVLSFGFWTYFVLRYAGLKVLVHDLFGNKADKREIGLLMWILLSFIFLAVGGIEVVSILFRLISLSFRLYGNVFGGENLIHALGAIMPFAIPAAAALLEVLVGLIQAFVFTLLSAVYIGLICNHEGGHDEEHAH
jgi:F0F1-type ATP synthase membrane subunit a